MRKHKIIRHFKRLPKLKEKEEFMQLHNIKFAYDSYHNMTIFADDGKLLFFPIIE